MSYQIVNEKLNIATCSLSDLTIEQATGFLKQWEYGAKLKELTLFFEHDTGRLVLNKDNPQYNTYLELAEGYLVLDEAQRVKKRKQARECLRETIYVLDNCLEARQFLDVKTAMEKTADACQYGYALRRIRCEAADEIDLLSKAYSYGLIQGKRAERTKRRR